VTKAAGLANDYAEMEIALRNVETGDAYDLTREVSYYSGTASGVDEGVPWTEHWVEDDSKDTVVIPAVPSGKYELWVQPKPGSTTTLRFTYTITIVRDVPRWSAFLLALPLILLPYWFYLWRRRSFEYRRWLESDYPMPSFTGYFKGGDDDA
jgi:hypothetical protein